MSNKKIYDFNGFRLDEDQKCLWRKDELVSLTPKAYETLLVLVKNKGKLISKNSLLDQVWSNTFVEEATLAQNISTLRRTLSKYDKGVEFISTVPRRGYRFVADVTEIVSEDEEVVLEKHSVTHIVAEQRQIHDSADTEIQERQTAPASAGIFSGNGRLIGLSVLGFSILAMGIAAFSYFSTAKTFYSSKFQSFRVNNIFSSPNIRAATVSPDGKYVAVIERKKAGDSILLRHITDGNMIEVLPISNQILSGITFSPESDYILYTAYSRGKSPSIGKLYRVPILGGAPQEIISDIDSPVAVSTDSKKLAFVRNNLKEKKSEIIVANFDGSEEKTLAARGLFVGYSWFGVSWSPDGTKISAAISDAEKDRGSQVVLVDTKTGEEKILTKDSWLWIGKTSWLNDGSGLAMVAHGAQSPNITDEVWLISYPSGEARVVANGLKGIVGLSLTDDLDSIVATKMNRITTSYVAPIDNLGDGKEIDKVATGDALLRLGVKWGGDQKIVFGKVQNGNADVWSMNADGSEKKRITSGKSADYEPVTSYDGKYVFFLSNRSGLMNIWRTDANGENPTQITKSGNFSRPSVSKKGDYIYYVPKPFLSPQGFLWRADFNGGNTKQITSIRTYYARVSPDGKYVLCYYPKDGDDPEDLRKPLHFTILLAETGEIVKQFDSLKTRAFPLTVWSADSKSYLYIEKGGKSTIWRQPINGDKPTKLKEWEDREVYQIAISEDGKRLFYEVGEEVNTVIELKDEPAAVE